MTAATDLRSLSVQDYHRIVAAGILVAGERAELIEGRLAFSDYKMVVREFLRSSKRRQKSVNSVGKSL